MALLLPSPGKSYLYIIAFVSGMTTLAIELSASRLLGNVFGSSNLVWANVIGLMLLYLTVGYFLGGRLADRYPRISVLLHIVIWAAFLCALIPLVARPIVTQAAQAVFGAEAALALGSFISVLVLFSIPVTMLGTVSPFVIRLAVESIDQAGKAAGQIYAISTLGSLLGTFLPALWLIPELGTTRAFLLFAGILFGCACLGLLAVSPKQALAYLTMPVIIVFLAHVSLAGPLRPPAPGASLIYADESAYNYIQVQEDADGYRYLYLNEGQGIHSQWHADEILYGGAWDYFLAAPFFNQPPFRADQVDSLLVIGLAAGTIPRQFTAIFGEIPIDGIEIDADIIDVGARFFGMNREEMPNLTAHAGDGRYLLNQMERSYSVIAIDAYRPPYIPWHLTTVEFFNEVKSLLRPNGVVAINVGRTDSDRRLVDALSGTMRQVFASVHALDVPRSFNTILFATADATSASNLRDNLELLGGTIDSGLYGVLQSAQDSLVSLGESAIVFTDDRAPVETLVDSIVLNFLLSGGAEAFRLDYES